MKNNNPKLTHRWGIIINVLGLFSLIGVVTTLGGILVIVDGALALSWRQPLQSQSTPVR